MGTTLNNRKLAERLANCWETTGAYMYRNESPWIQSSPGGVCYGYSHYGEIKEPGRQEDIAENKRLLTKAEIGSGAGIYRSTPRGTGEETWIKTGPCQWMLVDNWWDEEEGY